MQKLLKIIFATLILFLILFTQINCHSSFPTAYFFVTNESQDKKAVDISIEMKGKTVLSDIIEYISDSATPKYTKSTKLPKGKYTISITADSGKIKMQQPIMLDSDRYIYIAYSYRAPIDSTTIINNLGFPFAERLEAQKPQIKIQITHKQHYN